MNEMKYLKKSADLNHMKKTFNWYYEYMSKPEAERNWVRQAWYESNVRIVFRETFDVEFSDRDINHILKYLEANL